MPNPSELERAAEYVSGAWEVTDPAPAQPLRCWQEMRRVGPECPLVISLRKENARLRREVARLTEPDPMAVVEAAEKAK